MFNNRILKNLSTKKRLRKAKKYFGIVIKLLVLIVLTLWLTVFIELSWLLIPSIYSNRKPASQETKTALVLVIENNDYLNFDRLSPALFRKIALLIDPLNKKKIGQMNIPQLIDEYFEDYLSRKILAYSKQYDKAVYLTDQTAHYDNFLGEMEKLSKQEYQIDLLLHLHGGKETIWFTNQQVYSNQLVEDLNKIQPNIRYVYQTLCYGSSHLDAWQQIGVKNTNGARGRNSYVVFAPIKYSQYRQQGDSFFKASEKAYQYEKDLYDMVSVFLPQLKAMVSSEIIKGSELEYIQSGK